MDIPEACHASLQLKTWQIRNFIIAIYILFITRLSATVYFIVDDLVETKDLFRNY